MLRGYVTKRQGSLVIVMLIHNPVQTTLLGGILELYLHLHLEILTSPLKGNDMTTQIRVLARNI